MLHLLVNFPTDEHLFKAQKEVGRLWVLIKHTV